MIKNRQFAFINPDADNIIDFCFLQMDDGVLRTDVTLYSLKCNTEELYLTLMKAVTTRKELVSSMSMLGPINFSKIDWIPSKIVPIKTRQATFVAMQQYFRSGLAWQ